MNASLSYSQNHIVRPLELTSIQIYVKQLLFRCIFLDVTASKSKNIKRERRGQSIFWHKKHLRVFMLDVLSSNYLSAVSEEPAISSCPFLCLFRPPASNDAQSHLLHLFDFSPLCVFKCVHKFPASKDAYCICTDVLSTNYLPAVSGSLLSVAAQFYSLACCPSAENNCCRTAEPSAKCCSTFFPW